MTRAPRRAKSGGGHAAIGAVAPLAHDHGDPAPVAAAEQAQRGMTDGGAGPADQGLVD